jgi:hypothetical protein
MLYLFNNQKRKNITPMNRGIDIDTTAEWLNTSKSYCYRLVKWGELETVSTNPFSILPQSVIEFIGKKYPKVIEKNFSQLDYEIKQDGKLSENKRREKNRQRKI